MVAVFDGLPLANHALLRDAIIIDDPDDYASGYQRPARRQHGTATCSLVLHGDLSRDEPPLARPVYVRPILVPATDLDGNYRRAASLRLPRPCA